MVTFIARSTVTGPGRRFLFKIDPKTPIKELLPVPPPIKNATGPVIIKDLAQVPEVEFQIPQAKSLSSEEANKQIAHTIAKINHLNDKKLDGFLETLCRERLDLAGLPFAMGDMCRTKGERSRQFALAVATVRAALSQGAFTQDLNMPIRPPAIASATVPQPPPPPVVPTSGSQPQPAQPAGPASTPAPLPAPPVAADVAVPPPATLAERRPFDNFWEQYLAACAQEDKKLAQIDRAHQETVAVARIAALMQVLAPESPSIRLGLVKYLSSIAHVEATRALARMVIFSAEEEVRQAATDALKVRRERDYTDILLNGLRYPLPDVARRAAETLVKLERTDLVPQLVDLLDEPDPRAPVTRAVNHKQVPTVRELVRINHHRNCLLCHAPANTGSVAPDTLTAAVPVPSEPLPLPSQGYLNSSPDLLVRLDVTYLRQDFSLFQAVADANPWPEMQRFDFLVRTRVLTEKEAGTYLEKLRNLEPGRLSPYHRAALAAIRELTGRDTEPTANAWRRLLNLPAKPHVSPRPDWMLPEPAALN
jgi:hypothetical protein